MQTVSRGCAWLIVLLLGCPLLWAADPEIAVWEYAGRKTQAVVMGPDGSNPIVIFEKKLSRLSPSPTWSPEGDWIAIRARDESGAALYKLRVDGSDLTKVLCSVGTDRDGDPFDISGGEGAQWSPDGDWILVKVDGNSLGLVRADQEPDAGCRSDLIRFYIPDPAWEPVDQTGWWMQATPAWNHDGSKIAVFESYEEGDTQTDWRLQILEVAMVGGEPSVAEESPVSLPVSLQEVMQSFAYLEDLDWQRLNGELLTFDTKERDGDLVEWVSWIDSTNGEWGHLTQGFDASWSPDNSQIVFSGPELTIADLVYGQSGIPSVIAYHVIGSGQDADWRRGSQVESCTIDADCDDGNPCTADACSTGACLHPAEADDTPCGDHAFCRSGSCFEAECGYLDLPICDDLDGCTLDSCVDYRCNYDFDPGIPGCSGGLPGDPCTTGADCLSGLCHPKKHECK